MVLGVFQVNAQDNAPLVKKVLEVYDLVKSGYENRNADDLYKAAGILMQNPRIRPLQFSEFSSNNQANYFKPKVLLNSAILFTPIDKKVKRRKIKKRIDGVSNYQKMNLELGDFWIEPIDSLKAGSLVLIPQNYGEGKLVQFRLQNAMNLALSFSYAADSQVLVADSQKDPIGVYYTTKKSGQYEIEIKNISAIDASDILLIIMY